MTAWRKTYTSIDNVNNGQEFENSDYPTKEAFNVALNNTEALKTVQDSQANSISIIEQRLNDLGFKQGYFTAFVKYEEDDGEETYEETAQISSSDIQRNTLTREGNRFLMEFIIETPKLSNYSGDSFISFELIPHGQNVSDNYFKFKDLITIVMVHCKLLINYQQNTDVWIGVLAHVSSRKIYFSLEDIQFMIDDSQGYHVGVWYVQGIWLKTGLEAKD